MPNPIRNRLSHYASALGLRRDNRAVTALEYALIGAFIAIVIVVSVTAVGTTLAGVFASFTATFT